MQKVHEPAKWNRMNANHVIIIILWMVTIILFRITIFCSIMHTNQAYINDEVVSVQLNIRQRKASRFAFIQTQWNSQIKYLFV